MKMFSVTYRKSKSVNIHASFSTPKEAKKWMDEMLAQRKAARRTAKKSRKVSSPEYDHMREALGEF